MSLKPERIAAEVRAELARQRRIPSELATGIGMSRATLGRRLAGVSHFSLEELGRVAAWLGVTPEVLLSRAQEELETTK